MSGSLNSFKAEYFENQSKAQGAKIVDLEVKVAYLEGKVAFLEGRLKEERTKNATSTGPVAGTAERPPANALSEPVRPSSVPVAESGAASSSREPLLAISQKRPAADKLEPDPIPNLPATSWSPEEQPRKRIKREHEDGPSNSGPQAAVAIAPVPVVYYGQDSDDSDASDTEGAARIKDRLKKLDKAFVPDLTDNLQNLKVSREELNQHPWFIDPTSVICAHQYTRSFLFLTYARNPFLPKRAGKPGLIYWANDTPPWNERRGPYALFIGYKGQFQYFGEYQITPARALSVDEYGTWTHNLKDLWAESILRFSPFEDVRSRFVETPTDDSSDEEESERELRGKKRRKVKRAIIDAYEQGTERIYVWNMECIQFDTEFLQELQYVLDK
ncbi:hypothetical protein C8Q78DRAFT_755982 [Trametes maxima]|nr:hypothetical protein C8Q78DRAFT_755982 [Trametes maxima]